MNYYLSVLKRYIDFNGRARRKEFWMFVLFNCIAGIVASIIDKILGTTSVIGGLYSLAVLLPSLGVTARRLHDINKSGWFMLVSLIPLVGQIWLLILLVKEGDRSDNQYGPDPKANEIIA